MLSLMDAGFPLVALDYVPTDPAITAVGVDGLAAGSEATRYLLEQGARDILYMGHGRPERTEVDALLLEVGYRVAMEEAGLRPRSIFAAQATPQHAAEAFEAALRSGPSPDAIFTSNPAVIRGVWNCCEQRGLRPPEHQITLDFLVEFPELPAVRINMKRFCETALDLARQMTDAPGLGPRQVLVRARIDVPGRR
jgi:LacI family transcriptional regulator